MTKSPGPTLLERIGRTSSTPGWGSRTLGLDKYGRPALSCQANLTEVVILLMAVIVVVRLPGGKGHPRRHPRGGLHRIGFTGNEDSNAVSAQTLYELLARTLGYQDLKP